MKTKFLIPLMAGMALLCACKGKGNSGYEADTTSVNAPASTLHREKTRPVSDTVQSTAKLVKTADIRFKVKNVRQTSQQISELTKNLNGTVVHQIINSSSAHGQDVLLNNDSLMRVNVINTVADMTVKIPPAKTEEFVTVVSKMGLVIDSLKMNVNDKSLEYLSRQLKLKNKAEQVLQQKHEKNADELLALKNHMVDQQIINKAIDDSVKNTIITLHFYESNVISKEVVANDNLSNYSTSFSKRFKTAFETCWDMFENLVIAVAYVWIIIPLGIAVWLFVRYYRRKKAAAINT